MIQLPSEADIHCTAERLFDLITDFDGYHRWLTPSSAYAGTHEISDNPVVLGTTYREPGPFGVRRGTVTEYERPTMITFHQPMTLRFNVATIDATVRYQLTPRDSVTHVDRVVSLVIPARLRFLEPIVVAQFRHESARTLRALTAYADAHPA